jgi:hypothetical protein
VTAPLKPRPQTDRIVGLESGFPKPETAQNVHEEQDLQSAIDAYRFFYPTLSMECFFRSLRDLGIVDSGAIACFAARPHHQIFTASSDTPYSCGVLDLSASGPIVIEIPAGPYIALLNDHHQRWIADLGISGADAGLGGRYLLLPPEFCGVVPTGYRVARSATYKVLFAAKALPLEGGLGAALWALKRIVVRPLSSPDGALPYVDITEFPLDATPLRWETDLEYWNQLHSVLEREPILEEFRPMYGALAALGFRRGRRLVPDPRMQRILQNATRIGLEQMRVEAFASERSDRKVWSDRTWEWVCLLADEPNFEALDYLDLQARDRWFFQSLTLSPAMVRREAGMGSFCFVAVRDAEGAYLDGGNAYVLEVPEPVPAGLFWSVTAYDARTRSQILTSKNDAAISSLNHVFDADANGPLEIHFGPSPIPGRERHWIQTTPGSGFFVYFRVYGPEAESLDGTWRLRDLTRVASSGALGANGGAANPRK